MPLRQTTGFVESLLPLAGLDWAVPDFSTLCRRQQTLNVSLPYRGDKDPLNLVIDSTGIKAEGEGDRRERRQISADFARAESAASLAPFVGMASASSPPGC